MEQKFYICKHCGNIVAKVKDSGVPVMCCGEAMSYIEPNTVDASQEKHVPVVTREGSKVVVNVGTVAHPMTEEHLIEWISIQTKQGNQRKVLTAGASPVIEFMVAEDDTIEAVYAYCNLHGLWRV